MNNETAFKLNNAFYDKKNAKINQASHYTSFFTEKVRIFTVYHTILGVMLITNHIFLIKRQILVDSKANWDKKFDFWDFERGATDYLVLLGYYYILLLEATVFWSVAILWSTISADCVSHFCKNWSEMNDVKYHVIFD